MRKVIGIGETIFDIIFKDNRPVSGNPGGSVYNAMISLGRMGVPTQFISETGDDRIGAVIKDFLRENGVSSEFVCSFEGGKTPLALAFLDENQNADYVFYKDYPSQQLAYTLPQINEDDIVLVGSYFALNPVLRGHVTALLEEARRCHAIIYYDVNFRKTHVKEVPELMPVLVENFEISDIVKGSDEDFENIFGLKNAADVYARLQPHCPRFVYTQGAQGVTVTTDAGSAHYPARTITPVSTVGAGDSFNAGFIYGLLACGITYGDLQQGVPLAKWQKVVDYAVDFSAFVCTSYGNYISSEFAQQERMK